MQKSKTLRKFEIIASILVVVAMVGTTGYIIRAAEAGHFSLWPYPVFAVFAAGILCTYGILNASAGKEDRSYCPADLFYSLQDNP